MEKKRFTEEEVRGLFETNGVLAVTFTKSNGDKRLMVCCRDPKLDPEFVEPVVDPTKEKKTRAPIDGLCTVYEIGVGWRSFYYAKVINIDIPE